MSWLLIAPLLNTRTYLSLKYWSLSFNLPLKVICFAWLCLSNRINTWDTLWKKGWVGPNYCYLCFSRVESIDQLFSDCRFIKDIILGLSLALHRPIYWNEPSFRHNWANWMSNEKELLYLPLLMSWNIWITRNKYTFEDRRPVSKLVISNILEQLQTHTMTVLSKWNRILKGLD